MGLTIHYSLRARGSDARARNLINALHQAAQDLPFKEFGQVVELSGEQCDFNKRDRADPLHWLLIQASKHVELPATESQKRLGFTSSMRVTPERLIAFSTWPGEGCEQANFGLCKFPALVETDAGPLKTKLSGWRWR